MPAITIQPNPTTPRMVRVLGTGFDRRVFVAIVFEGIGATTKFKPTPQGTFDVGLDVVSTKPDGTYVVQARKAGTTTVLATTNLIVKRIDPVPVVLSGPTIYNITQTTASVTWTVSENATGKINYGLTTSFGMSTPEEASLNYSTHTQNISNLLANTGYSLEVVGKDSAGQLYAAQGSFKTLDVVITPVGKVVNVSNITDLRKNLADNTVDEIICEDGRYIASTGTGTGSFWIGSSVSGGTAFAERTRPIIVRARNKHKAIIENGYLSFEDGAHDQIWDGFRHSNIEVRSNGVINFGGYSARKAPYNITIRNVWIDNTCKALSPTGNQDHAIYPAHGINDGPHDIIVEDFLIDGENLNGAIHSWHPEVGQEGFQPRNLTFRRGIINKPWWGIVAGHLKPVVGYLFEDIQINGARNCAVGWYELNQVQSVHFRRVVSTNSAVVYEWSGSRAALPPGVPGMTFEGCTFG